jgi:hypothetical protein
MTGLFILIVKSIARVLLWAVLITGCSPLEPTGIEPADISDVVVPEGFQFDTRIEHFFRIEVTGPQRSGYPGLAVRLEKPNGELIHQAITDHRGSCFFAIVLPASWDQVIINAPAIGVICAKQNVLLIEQTHNLAIN